MGYGATTAEISQIGVGDPEAADWRVLIDRRVSNGKMKTLQTYALIVVPYSAVLYFNGWLAQNTYPWASYRTGEAEHFKSFDFSGWGVRIASCGFHFDILRENVRVY